MEAAVVLAVAIGSWAFLYSPLLPECCGGADMAILGVLWSASVIGGLLTGGGSNPGRGAVLVGLIIEALAVWAIVRVVVIAAVRARGKR